MRKFFHSSAAAVAFLAAACVVQGGLSPLLAAEPFSGNWSGPYVGANGGYAWSGLSASYNPNDPAAASISNGPNGTLIANSDFDFRGGFGGIQIGQNWQVSPLWVYGFEADFQFGDIKGKGNSSNIIGGANPATVSTSLDSKWFGTARVKLGRLITSDLQIYGTGGLAFGQVEQNANYIFSSNTGIVFGGFSFLCVAGIPCFQGSSSSFQIGWTLGGGAEWKIAENLTLKTEYLYVNLGARSVQMTATPFGANPSASFRVKLNDMDSHLIRLGLNYRFNTGAQ